MDENKLRKQVAQILQKHGLLCNNEQCKIKLDCPIDYELTDFINQHVAQVIGEDEDLKQTGGDANVYLHRLSRNKLRTEQRKRAGLKDN